MSFDKPYQKSTGKTVHRASRKAKFSATVGFLNPKRYAASKKSPDAPADASAVSGESEEL